MDTVGWPADVGVAVVSAVVGVLVATAVAVAAGSVAVAVAGRGVALAVDVAGAGAVAVAAGGTVDVAVLVAVAAPAGCVAEAVAVATGTDVAVFVGRTGGVPAKTIVPKLALSSVLVLIQTRRLSRRAPSSSFDRECGGRRCGTFPASCSSDFSASRSTTSR